MSRLVQEDMMESQTKSPRIVSRELARELTEEELKIVAGGDHCDETDHTDCPSPEPRFREDPW